MSERVACFSRAYASLTERRELPETDFAAEFRTLEAGPHRARLSCVDSGETRILSVHDRAASRCGAR